MRTLKGCTMTGPFGPPRFNVLRTWQVTSSTIARVLCVGRHVALTNVPGVLSGVTAPENVSLQTGNPTATHAVLHTVVLVGEIVLVRQNTSE